MKSRELKTLLYEHVARIGKAISSPKRLELLGLLVQGEKAVESLATELGIDMRLASAHLKALREARLVTARRDGKHMIYRLSGDDVAALWVRLNEVAEEHLLDLRAALTDLAVDAAPQALLGRDELIEQARRGEIVVIDVRPADEYRTAHLPYARSLPITELEGRLDELPRDREIVAYCRGRFCVIAGEAAQRLRERGYRIRVLPEGVGEWRAAGAPLEQPSAG